MKFIHMYGNHPSLKKIILVDGTHPLTKVYFILLK
jgi:hypothetical protein